MGLSALHTARDNPRRIAAIKRRGNARASIRHLFHHAAATNQVTQTVIDNFKLGEIKLINDIYIMSILVLALIASCVSPLSGAYAQESRGSVTLATQVSTLRSAVASMSNALRSDVASLRTDVESIRSLVDKTKHCGNQKAIYGPSHADADPDGCVPSDGITWGSSIPSGGTCEVPHHSFPMSPTSIGLVNGVFGVTYSGGQPPTTNCYNRTWKCSRTYTTSLSSCRCHRSRDKCDSDSHMGSN